MNSTENTAPPLRLESWTSRFCKIIGILLSGAGIAIFLSWIVLKRNPQDPLGILQDIPFFLALCYLLTGFSLYAFALEIKRGMGIFAACMIGTGLFTLVYGAFNFFPLGAGSPWQSFFEQSKSMSLGWARLTGGVTTVLMGCWTFRFQKITRTTSRASLSLVIGSIIACAGIFSLTQRFLAVPLLNEVAFTTFYLVSGGQIVLGALLLAISYVDHDRLFPNSLWSWLLLPLGVSLIMGTVVMGTFLMRQQKVRISKDIRGTTAQIEAILNTLLNERIYFLKRLSSRLESAPTPNVTESAWENGIRMFLNDHPDLVRIRWFNEDSKDLWTMASTTFPKQKNSSEDYPVAALSNLTREEEQRDPESITMLRTNSGFMLISPIEGRTKKPENRSFLLFEFDSRLFFHTLPKLSISDEYMILIRDESENILFGNFDNTLPSRPENIHINRSQINLQGLLYNIDIYPLPSSLTSQVSILPWIVIAAGCAISLLLLWAYWLAQTTLLARLELEDTNMILSDEVRRRSVSEKQLRETQDELEIKIKDRTDQLTRSNQELEQFAFIASHDLQEPVRKVANYLDLLMIHAKESLSEEAKHDVERIMRSVTHMKSLLSELMGLLRVRHDNAPFELVSLEEELHNILSNMDNVESIDIKVDPLPKVMGNRLRIRQLFQNLISNAVKFRGQEAPNIHVSAYQEGDEWVISVRDNGIGIEPSHKKRIFEIFQRLNPRGYPGTGMGLAICQKIIESHGGRIWVESAPGFGSTFKFTLPQRKEVATKKNDEITVG